MVLAFIRSLAGGPPSRGKVITEMNRRHINGLRPHEQEKVAAARRAGATGQENDDEREVALEELAKHTEYTLDELREMSDEELKAIVEDLDVDEIDALNIRLAFLEDRADRVLDDNVDGVDAGGYFHGQDARDGDEVEVETGDFLADSYGAGNGDARGI